MGYQKLIGLGWLILSSAHAAIYKWVDEYGVVHYSDQPHKKGQKPIRQLPGLTTYTPRKIKPLSPQKSVPPPPNHSTPPPSWPTQNQSFKTPSQPNMQYVPPPSWPAQNQTAQPSIQSKKFSNHSASITPNPYRQLQLVSPEQNARIKGDRLLLFIALAPVLQKGHYFSIELDGRLLKQHYYKSVIPLSGLSKGLHQIRIGVQNEQGQFLIRSESTLFQIL